MIEPRECRYTNGESVDIPVVSRTRLNSSEFDSVLPPPIPSFLTEVLHADGYTPRSIHNGVLLGTDQPK